MNIRILLVDDFPLIREGFAAALEHDPGLNVVAEADKTSVFVGEQVVVTWTTRSPWRCCIRWRAAASAA